ncbi:ATP-binding protein [Actinoplanes sp. CA-051413]|uniref:ATP-binding protein n=1 Tax=Actinoplanes sp. CA-051413 TaxID=3239899 RepID=UPI003D99E403
MPPFPARDDSAPEDSAGGRLAVLDDVPATGSACGVGRRFVAGTLRGWGVPDELVEISVLITSELVANAVNHAPPPGYLQVQADDERIRIEVSDAGGAEPRIVRPGDAVAGGRGLLLVDRLAARWGWKVRPRGKVVWCEVSLPAASQQM